MYLSEWLFASAATEIDTWAKGSLVCAADIHDCRSE
jgi:hypothetical protein